ncbi:MAG: hypothetical protein V3U72_02540 [Candidatus Aenigmarchaeota archaeon]
MNEIRGIELEREFRPGGALYQVVEEDDGYFLLGLGLWDRPNVKHSKEVKDRTKGQIVRIDENDNEIGRSPELSNIIYQLDPIDDDRIFVGCRSGDLLYLNRDLSIDRKLDLENSGLYFWIRDGNNLIATMRAGAALFLDLETEDYQVVQLLDPDVRMWPIARRGDNILMGSYKGDLVLMEERDVVKKTRVKDNRSAIWTIDPHKDGYLVGTAQGKLFYLSENLEEIIWEGKIPTGVTSTERISDNQLVIGDFKGNLHMFSDSKCRMVYQNPEDVKNNPIWWITYDQENHLIRTAYANGQMRTFKGKTGKYI